MALIKICGLRRREDIDCANACQPDFIGFVFAESRRRVGDSEAAALRRRLDPKIRAVGVFVNEEPARIKALCHSGVIDWVQLHGDEDDAYIRRLRGALPNPVIKAAAVRASVGPSAPAPHISAAADYMLFDAYSGAMRGGSGTSFDWAAIAGLHQPYFLAGGLNISNLAQAIAFLDPYCVDLSSGAETDGFKDPAKMSAAVDIARRTRGRGRG